MTDAQIRISLWPAPTATAPVHAMVRLPGSKSITNRALVLAALASGPSTLAEPLIARDTRLMAGALTSLGTEITEREAAWQITPAATLTGNATVDCGLAGTVMRFVPPVAALADGDVTFDGDAHARRRPMGIVIDALRQLGASVSDDDRDAMPFTVHGSGSVTGGKVTIDASESSQFVSCLLLSGARYDKGVVVHHDGKPVPSLPHIDMTVRMLRENGVEVDDDEPNTWRVEPGPIKPIDRVVEPDLSNAAPFLGAALVTGGTVRIPGWPRATDQPGDQLRDLLSQMGAQVELDDDGLTATGTGTIKGIDADLHDVSELTPVIAAIAALADGPTYIRGVAHIRGHETDRLRALATELNVLGGDVDETEDGLHIRPTALTPGIFHTYNDHRMAHAGALLGLRADGIQVENIATTAKTMPEFPDLWTRAVAEESPA